MAAPRPSDEALALWDRVAAELGDPAIERGRMMGRPILKHRGTMFACLNGELLALKLGEGTPQLAAALAVPGAELFDPGSVNRPFKAWATIPITAAEHWIPFAADAHAFVATTP